MDKQNVAYPYNGILFSHKNTTTWMNLANIILSKEARHKRPHIV